MSLSVEHVFDTHIQLRHLDPLDFMRFEETTTHISKKCKFPTFYMDGRYKFHIFLLYPI